MTPEQIIKKSDDVSSILADKMREPGKIPFTHNQWNNSGYECNKKTIAQVILTYLNLFYQDKTPYYDPFDKLKTKDNEKTINNIYTVINGSKKIQGRMTRDKTAVPDLKSFIYFIMVNYRGWDKDSYDKARYDAGKIAQRKKVFAESWDKTKGIMKTSVKVAAGAAIGYGAMNFIVPLAIALISSQIKKR